jgi:hypothetical protein
MTSTTAGALSRHAQERVFQRTHLTPLEVQLMLDNRQFCWARRPRASEDRYAVVYDVVAKDYLVAVVEPKGRVVKTVLTLEQFEASHFRVSDAVRLLCRLTLVQQPDNSMEPKSPEKARFLQDCLDEAPEPAPMKPARDALVWRFAVVDAAGITWPLAAMEASFLAGAKVNPEYRTPRDVGRQARRLVASDAFLGWFVHELVRAEISLESVTGLVLQMLDPASYALLYELPLTDDFLEVLVGSLSVADTAGILAGSDSEGNRLEHAVRQNPALGRTRRDELMGAVLRPARVPSLLAADAPEAVGE